jgi:uncharacterized protein
MIGILSDSHDNLTMIRRAVSVFRSAECSLVIHAGDIVAPFAAVELAETGCPVYAVFGNCDGERAGLVRAFQAFGEIREGPWSFEYAGLTALVTHIEDPLPTTKDRKTWDLLVCGHTHKAEVRKEDNRMVVNPGETCGWVNGIGTVALFDPEKRIAEIIPL